MKKKGMLYLWFVAVIDLLFFLFFFLLLLTQFGAPLSLPFSFFHAPSPEEAGSLTLLLKNFLGLYIAGAVVALLTRPAETYLLFGQFMGSIHGAKRDPVLPISMGAQRVISLTFLGAGILLIVLLRQLPFQSYSAIAWMLLAALLLIPLDFCALFFYGLLQAHRQKKEEPLL